MDGIKLDFPLVSTPISEIISKKESSLILYKDYLVKKLDAVFQEPKDADDFTLGYTTSRFYEEITVIKKDILQISLVNMYYKNDKGEEEVFWNVVIDTSVGVVRIIFKTEDFEKAEKNRKTATDWWLSK